MRRTKIIFFIIVAAAVLAVSYFAGSMGFFKENILNKPLSYEAAVSRLNGLVTDVAWTRNIVKRRAKIKLGQPGDLKQILPDISQFSLMVEPQLSANDVVVEIFVTTQRSGTGTDGWLNEVGRAFNALNQRLSNGKTAKVKIRKIASGTGYQFIASRKYLPDAYAPVHQLWIDMADAQGIPVTPIRKEIFGSIAGIVMKTSVAEKLESTYGNVDVKTLVNAVVDGNLAMGYTNPFASSTGLNFLVTVLATFADNREDAMLSPEVISAFESFQRGVPFVAMTTLHMRDSVKNDGSLDAFVMGYQTYINTVELQTGYKFIPFGVRHSNPLYAIGNLSGEKMEVLEKFALFAEKPKNKKKAFKYGFNPPFEYTTPFEKPSGKTLIQAQKIWKLKKDAGRRISAIFLCDVSGSMSGTRIKALKKSLIGGSEFIAPGNSIGLVLFSDRVSVVLPVAEFNLNQKAAFHAAVEDMAASGGTAMYDGIAVSLMLLNAEKKNNPDNKITLFVLTDGETKTGIDFGRIRPVVEGMRIPIYTIGYDANLKVLKELSSIVEAASLNAGEEEIQFKIGSLLNAQM